MRSPDCSDGIGYARETRAQDILVDDPPLPEYPAPESFPTAPRPSNAGLKNLLEKTRVALLHPTFAYAYIQLYIIHLYIKFLHSGLASSTRLTRTPHDRRLIGGADPR